MHTTKSLCGQSKIGNWPPEAFIFYPQKQFNLTPMAYFHSKKINTKYKTPNAAHCTLHSLPSRAHCVQSTPSYPQEPQEATEQEKSSAALARPLDYCTTLDNSVHCMKRVRVESTAQGTPQHKTTLALYLCSHLCSPQVEGLLSTGPTPSSFTSW